MTDASFLPQILLIIGLIGLSAFFSSAETALTSLGHLKRKKLVAEKKSQSIYIEKLFQSPGRMITTILVGNNTANISASIIATMVFVEWLKSWGIHSEFLVTAITTVFMTATLLIFGEITPKMFAIRNAEKVVPLISRPIYYFSIIFFPIIELLNWISNLLIRISRGKNLEKHSLVSEEEIKILINMGLQEGVLEEEEEKMLTSIIEFGDIVVREIMTPRLEIIAVDVESTVRKVVNVIKEHWHSRLPVYAEKMDNIVGFIYAKDLLAAGPETRDDLTYIKGHMREAFFVPESKRIDELLKDMKKEKRHVAMVVDEYGGISGLVTIEDIIEEIVGEIQDEYDELEDDMLKKIADNVYIVSGLMNVSDLNNNLGIHIPEADNYDSVAGYIVDRLGKLPSKGAVVEDDHVRLITLHVASRRITKVKLEIKLEGADNRDS